MADYMSMYTKLFYSVTDAISLLQQAQVKTEEMFISQNEPDIRVIRSESDGVDDVDSEDNPN